MLWILLTACLIATWSILSTLASERQIKVATLQIEHRRALDEAARIAAKQQLSE